MTLDATGGVVPEPAASGSVHVPVPHESPLLLPFPFAYRTARLNVTSPVPAVGAVQSAHQVRAESVLWVNSPLANWTCGPRFDQVPWSASRLNPPSPEMWGPPSQVREYVDPGVYPPAPQGRPLSEGERPPVFAWQVHPDTELPVFPVEFESTVYGTDMSSSITTSAATRLVARMRLRVCAG